MSAENTNNHVKFLSKACLVLGIPAAILAAFRISYGAFILGIYVFLHEIKVQP